jgi:hypothetical protein
MSDIMLLIQAHNLTQSDPVIVTERFNSGISYRGEIYKIINKPLNERILHYKNTYIDYFYIKFDEPIYHLLLKRGLEIIYNHKPMILGNVDRDASGRIEKIHSQPGFPESLSIKNETQIRLENIDAMLVWRIAFNIQADE